MNEDVVDSGRHLSKPGGYGVTPSLAAGYSPLHISDQHNLIRSPCSKAVTGALPDRHAAKFDMLLQPPEATAHPRRHDDAPDLHQT